MTFRYLNTQRKGMFSEGKARRATLANCSRHRPMLALTLCLGSQKVMAGQTQPPGFVMLLRSAVHGNLRAGVMGSSLKSAEGWGSFPIPTHVDQTPASCYKCSWESRTKDGHIREGPCPH